MHYIGMLAFILPIPVAYHWPTVLLSLFAAILASVVAAERGEPTENGASRALRREVSLMGAGIASMHYIGMAAMAFTGYMPVLIPFSSSCPSRSRSNFSRCALDYLSLPR